ncbi:unnamed protein product [Cochlearia groenlandica]
MGEDSTTRGTPCKTLREKCSHMAKKQRAKFYILGRCIAMLVCGRDRNNRDCDRVST